MMRRGKSSRRSGAEWNERGEGESYIDDGLAGLNSKTRKRDTDLARIRENR